MDIEDKQDSGSSSSIVTQMSSLLTSANTTSSLSTPPKLTATDAASFADWRCSNANIITAIS